MAIVNIAKGMGIAGSYVFGPVGGVKLSGLSVSDSGVLVGNETSTDPDLLSYSAFNNARPWRSDVTEPQTDTEGKYFIIQLPHEYAANQLALMISFVRDNIIYKLAVDATTEIGADAGGWVEIITDVEADSDARLAKNGTLFIIPITTAFRQLRLRDASTNELTSRIYNMELVALPGATHAPEYYELTNDDITASNTRFKLYHAEEGVLQVDLGSIYALSGVKVFFTKDGNNIFSAYSPDAGFRGSYDADPDSGVFTKIDDNDYMDRVEISTAKKLDIPLSSQYRVIGCSFTERRWVDRIQITGQGAAGDSGDDQVYKIYYCTDAAGAGPWTKVEHTAARSAHASEDGGRKHYYTASWDTAIYARHWKAVNTVAISTSYAQSIFVGRDIPCELSTSLDGETWTKQDVLEILASGGVSYVRPVTFTSTNKARYLRIQAHARWEDIQLSHGSAGSGDWMQFLETQVWVRDDYVDFGADGTTESMQLDNAPIGSEGTATPIIIYNNHPCSTMYGVTAEVELDTSTDADDYLELNRKSFSTTLLSPYSSGVLLHVNTTSSLSTNDRITIDPSSGDEHRIVSAVGSTSSLTVDRTLNAGYSAGSVVQSTWIPSIHVVGETADTSRSNETQKALMDFYSNDAFFLKAASSLNEPVVPGIEAGDTDMVVAGSMTGVWHPGDYIVVGYENRNSTANDANKRPVVCRIESISGGVTINVDGNYPFASPKAGNYVPYDLPTDGLSVRPCRYVGNNKFVNYDNFGTIVGNANPFQCLTGERWDADKFDGYVPSVTSARWAKMEDIGSADENAIKFFIGTPVQYGIVTSAGNDYVEATGKFTEGEYDGSLYRVDVVYGIGEGQSRVITTNTTDRLNITPSWNENPDSTSTFMITKIDEPEIDRIGVRLPVTSPAQDVYIYTSIDNSDWTLLIEDSDRPTYANADEILLTSTGTIPAGTKYVKIRANDDSHQVQLIKVDIYRSTEAGTYIDTANRVKYDGYINSFKVKMAKAGFVRVKAFREEGANYRLLGQSERRWMSVGLNDIELGCNENIVVRSGDYVAIYVDDSGSLEYDSTGGNTTYYNEDASSPTIAQSSFIPNTYTLSFNVTILNQVLVGEVASYGVTSTTDTIYGRSNIPGSADVAFRSARVVVKGRIAE